MLPLALFERAQWQTPTLTTFSMMLFLGVFCSVIAFLLYNLGLKKLSPSSVTSMLNLMPIFGVLFSWLLLGERVTLQKIIGGAIVILGVMLSLRKSKPQSALPEIEREPGKQPE